MDCLSGGLTGCPSCSVASVLRSEKTWTCGTRLMSTQDCMLSDDSAKCIYVHMVYLPLIIAVQQVCTPSTTLAPVVVLDHVQRRRCSQSHAAQQYMLQRWVAG